jgi:Flp pilus assembly protein TadG
MKTFLRLTRNRRGFAAIYVAITSMLLVPMVGLAIDLGILYNVRAKLQAAVDAAAIGSGNMLQRSTDMTNTTTINNIKDAASRFFNANFPSTYWGTTRLYYDSTPSEDTSTKIRTIYVHAGVTVPSLFLRLLRISSSSVAAEASVNIRFVTLMIVVDRSGSVVNGGADSAVRTALNTFVATQSSSVFVDGRDVVGMVSFGGNWHLDLAPTVNFRSGTSSISTAITNIPFDNASNTNTGDGLYQGYYQLQKLNQPNTLNVIILLTDGRPSAFSGQFAVNAGSPCTDKTDKKGFLGANVSSGSWPPPQTIGSGGIQTYGVYKDVWANLGGDATIVSNSNGCAFNSNSNNMNLDINPFPNLAGPVSTPDGAIAGPNKYSTTTGYKPGEGTDTTDPRAIRYAAYNVADNIATMIRQDTAIRPTIFVIGLNESTGEPLDADWLARVANDPSYRDASNNSVFQAGQTSGMYYNVTTSSLSSAFDKIASQILRLSQ